MQFSIAIPTDADSWRLVRRAEELGFSAAWFYDTQMLSADCFVAMAAAAMKTTRIRLGTGVLIPSNRIPAVTANAFASLNKLAPGRIDFGVGTGFTGRRAMGLGAIRLAEMEDYIRVVQALLRGEEVETEIEGKRRLIRLLNPDAGLINLADPIPLYIAASGPRSRALTAKLGAGWIDTAGFGDLTAGIRQMQETWQAAGRSSDSLVAIGFSGGAVLEEGEPFDSARAIAVAGPRAVTLLHRAADKALAGFPNPVPVSDELADTVSAYVEHASGFRPQGAGYLRNHRGHLMFVRDDERPFVTAELIRQMTFTGTLSALGQKVEALIAAGYTQIAISIPPGQTHAIEDWGRLRRMFA